MQRKLIAANSASFSLLFSTSIFLFKNMNLLISMRVHLYAAKFWTDCLNLNTRIFALKNLFDWPVHRYQKYLKVIKWTKIKIFDQHKKADNIREILRLRKVDVCSESGLNINILWWKADKMSSKHMRVSQKFVYNEWWRHKSFFQPIFLQQFWNIFAVYY